MFLHLLFHILIRYFFNVNLFFLLLICFLPFQNVMLLEQEEDVNQLTDFFSYEHFYVIYCKFWELDTDHDLYIDQSDMARHNDQGAQRQLTLCS